LKVNRNSNSKRRGAVDKSVGAKTVVAPMVTIDPSKYVGRVRKWIDRQKDGEIDDVLGPKGSIVNVKAGMVLLNGDYVGPGAIVTCEGGVYFIDEHGNGIACDPSTLTKAS
jgi:hypothetical protein